MKEVTNPLWKCHRFFIRRSQILYSVGDPHCRGLKMVIIDICRVMFCWKMYQQFMLITCVLIVFKQNRPIKKRMQH